MAIRQDHNEKVGYLYLMQVADLYKVGKTKNIYKRVRQYRSGYPRARCLYCRTVLMEDLQRAENSLVAAIDKEGIPKLVGRREWYLEEVPRDLFMDTLSPFLHAYTQHMDRTIGLDYMSYGMDHDTAISMFAYLREIPSVMIQGRWSNWERMVFITLLHRSFDFLSDVIEDRLELMPRWMKAELEDSIVSLQDTFRKISMGVMIHSLRVMTDFYIYTSQHERDSITKGSIKDLWDSLVNMTSALESAEAAYELLSEYEPEFVSLEQVRKGDIFQYSGLKDIMDSAIRYRGLKARLMNISITKLKYYEDLAVLSSIRTATLNPNYDFFKRTDLPDRLLRVALFVISIIHCSTHCKEGGYRYVLQRAKVKPCPCGSSKVFGKCCMKKYSRKTIFIKSVRLIPSEHGYSYALPAVQKNMSLFDIADADSYYSNNFVGEEDEGQVVVAGVLVRMDGTWELLNREALENSEFGAPPRELIDAVV